MTDKEIRAAVSHFRNLTLEERKEGNHREWFDYTFARWRMNAKRPKTWVTRPHIVEIPAKHGLYSYATFNQYDIMLVGPDPLAVQLRGAVLNGQWREVQEAVECRLGGKTGGIVQGR